MNVVATGLARSSVRLLAVLAIGALLFAVYRPALDGPFLLDDASNLPQTEMSEFDPKQFSAIVFGNASGTFGRPIPVATFALNYLLGDGSSSSFKTTNLVLHAINAILVYLFVLLALRRLIEDQPTGRLAYCAPSAIALVVAAVWALHPLQVSTVMYVVQRMTIMMTGFTLASLICYVRLRNAHIAGKPVRLLSVIPVTVFAAFACLSKENGVLVLLYVIVLEFTLFDLRASPGEEKRLRSGLLAFVVAPLTIALALFAFKAESFMRGYAVRSFDMFDRLLTEPSVVLSYVRMTLWPNLDEMTFYHDDFPVTTTVDGNFITATGGILVVAVAAVALRRRYPVLALGAGLFLVSHLVESTFLPLEIMFEHRNYFGIIGLTLPLCWLAFLLASQSRHVRAFPVTGLLIVLLLSTQTHARAREWSSELSLAIVLAEKSPRSARAQSTLAITLFETGQPDAAVHQMDLAMKRIPLNSHVALLATHIGALAGLPDRKAYDNAARLLEQRPLTANAGDVLSQMISSLRHPGYALDASDVLTLTEKALTSPRTLIDRSSSAILNALHADLLARVDRSADAVLAFERAIDINPDDPEIRFRFADLLLILGDRERALQVLEAATTIGTDRPILPTRFDDLFRVKTKHADLAE